MYKKCEKQTLIRYAPGTSECSDISIIRKRKTELYVYFQNHLSNRDVVNLKALNQKSHFLHITNASRPAMPF